MADKRMFSKSVIDTDQFIEMPVSARLLYFDLGMRADDDGFITPKRVMKMTGATEDDLRILITRKYVIPFDSGVIVIRHWRMNNYLKSDRYKETEYKEEKGCLELVENRYEVKDGTNLDTKSLQTGYTGKDRIELEIEIENKEESNSLRSLSSSCPEQSKESSALNDDLQVFIEIPLIGGKSAKITESYVKQAEELYPAIDVRQTIRNAKGWLLDNPKNRKSDWKRFLGSWLRREQDKALRVPQPGPAIRKNIKAAPDYDPDQEVKVTKISFDEEDS